MSPSNVAINPVKTSTAIRPSAQNSSTEKIKNEATNLSNSLLSALQKKVSQGSHFIFPLRLCSVAGHSPYPQDPTDPRRTMGTSERTL